MFYLRGEEYQLIDKIFFPFVAADHLLFSPSNSADSDLPPLSLSLSLSGSFNAVVFVIRRRLSVPSVSVMSVLSRGCPDFTEGPPTYHLTTPTSTVSDFKPSNSLCTTVYSPFIVNSHTSKLRQCVK